MAKTNIVFHNSDTCPFDTAVDILIYVLGFKMKDAIQKVYEVHTTGQQVVYTTTGETASQLAIEIEQALKEREASLTVTLEKVTEEKAAV